MKARWRRARTRIARFTAVRETTGSAKYDMTTFDEVVVQNSVDFMKRSKAAGKPFFVWHNTTRTHVWSFLSEHTRI